MSKHKIKIISIGSNCTIKFSLNVMKINQETYPFDWILTSDPHSISKILNNPDIYLDFKNYSIVNYDFSNNVFVHEEVRNCFALINRDLLIKLYRDYQDHKIFEDILNKLVSEYPQLTKQNIKTFLEIIVFQLQYDGITFVHDHKFSELYESIAEKYKRRISRFNELVAMDCVIFVRHNIGKDSDIIYNFLCNKFGNKFALIELNQGEYSMNIVNDKYYKVYDNLNTKSSPFHKNLIETCLKLVKSNNKNINL